MTQIVAICNQKGGVGKTSVTINLGAALAELGQRVLLVDLDPQGHLTDAIGLQEIYVDDSQAAPTIYDGLFNGARLAQLIRRHPKEQFSFIPSHYRMQLAEQQLSQ